MILNPKIFKAYDIRGVYPTELDEKMAYKIGQSFANYTKNKAIIIGWDTRLSSPSLSENLIKGILDQGVDVIDIGLCSTSCFYYTVGESDSSGIMITASHASKENNGFKMVFEKNIPLTQKQILELKEMFLKENFESKKIKGKVFKKNANEKYINKIRNSVKDNIKPFKVVMDAGNGMAGLYIEKVFSDIGIDLVPIFTNLDGNFPNHETNPKLPENRESLKKKVVEEEADLGFMFDGDADRVCVVDRRGDLFDYNLLMAILSEYMIKNSSRKKIVIEVRTSNIVRDWVKKLGGEIITSVCWTIPIKLEMQNDSEIVFGGETSGHYVFPELHETDDGIMAALVFLQAISIKEMLLDEMINDFKSKYFVPDEKNFKMPSMKKADEVLENLKIFYKKEGGKILEIDGISAIFPDWKFNLRKSQTEPVIRLNMETNSKELLKQKQRELEDKIKANI